MTTGLIEQSFTMSAADIQTRLLSQYTSRQTNAYSKDLNDFWYYFELLVSKLLENEGATEDIRVSEGWPEAKADRPWQEIINFEVDLRQPGGFGTMNPYQRAVSTKIMNPQLVEQGVVDMENPGYVIDYFSQEFDNWIFINCWSRTNKEANARAMWVENLLSDFRWYFKAVGVHRVLWLGQHASKEYAPYPGGDIYYGRPLYVYVRTCKVWGVRQKTLEEIQVIIDTDLNNTV